MEFEPPAVFKHLRNGFQGPGLPGEVAARFSSQENPAYEGEGLVYLVAGPSLCFLRTKTTVHLR